MQQSSNKPAPTAAQQAIIHVAQSAALSGLVSLLVGIVQYLSAGSIDLKTLLTVLGSGFLTALTMIYKSISSNPNLAQAALDTANEAHAKIDQLAPWLAKPPKSVPTPITFPSAQSIQHQPTAVLPAYPPAQQSVRTSTLPPADSNASYAGQSPFANGLSYADLNRQYNQPVQAQQQGQQVRGG